MPSRVQIVSIRDLPPDVERALRAHVGDGDFVVHVTPYGRERGAEVLDLYAEGVTVPGIAAQLGFADVCSVWRILAAARAAGRLPPRDVVHGSTSRSLARRAAVLRMLADGKRETWVASYFGVSLRWVRTMRRDHEREMASRASAAPAPVEAPRAGDESEEVSNG